MEKNSAPSASETTSSHRQFLKKSSEILESESALQRLKKETNPENNTLLAELNFLNSSECDFEKFPHLSDGKDLKDFPMLVTPLIGDSKYRSVYGGEGFLPEDAFISENSFVLSQASFGPKKPISGAKKFLRAGPRRNIYFQPEEVRACIVTCGGLCPGLNVVIREIFMCLHYNYGVKTIFGVMFGYKGFYEYEWKELTPENVKTIHTLGGTILGSSRGGFNLDKMIEGIEKHGINHVYCVGGDGTHRGIDILHQGCLKKGLKVSVVGIPKTIDNDIAIIDKSFGFETAVEEAQRAIESADVEATSAENGIGLVKLMGRQAGFIAMYSALANRDVNICLVPEFEFDLEGPRGLLEYIYRRLKIKHHCVIVVAEGAGSAIRDAKLENLGYDASGNPKLPDVGVFLKEKITSFLKKKGMESNLKYIDPTYMIRTVPANSFDKQICSQLAQNAVHGAMAGWTGFTVGIVNNRTCWIPLHLVTHPEHPVNIQKDDRAWHRLMASTGQPSFLNGEDDYAKEEKRIKETPLIKIQEAPSNQ